MSLSGRGAVSRPRMGWCISLRAQRGGFVRWRARRGRLAAVISKRENLDLVGGEVMELAGGPRRGRRTSRQTPSANRTLSSMTVHVVRARRRATAVLLQPGRNRGKPRDQGGSPGSSGTSSGGGRDGLRELTGTARDRSKRFALCLSTRKCLIILSGSRPGEPSESPVRASRFSGAAGHPAPPAPGPAALAPPLGAPRSGLRSE